MARQVQLRRGTTTEHSTFTGAVGEVTVDTDKDVVVVHDGATAGGVPMLKAADLPTDFVSAASGGTFSGDVTVAGELKATSYNESYVAVTSSAGSVVIDCEAGNAFSHVLTENTTVSLINFPASGTLYVCLIEIIQDAAASGFTVDWSTPTKWPGGTAPTLTSTANAIDAFSLYTRDGGTTLRGRSSGLDSK